jgi:hypothetical protein
MQINIYVGNHGKLGGIEDIVSILRSAFARQGHEVFISEELNENFINIIIDEFTNYLRNTEIMDFKSQHPEAIVVFVLTEFIETRYLVRSFNFFDGLLEASAIAELTILLRLRRKDFLAPSIRDWVVGLIYMPLFFIMVITHFAKEIGRKQPESLSSRLHRTAYLAMRFLGLERMIGYADCIVLTHDLIAAGVRKLDSSPKIAGTVYPEINEQDIQEKILKGKVLQLEVTGSITPFRKKVIEKMNLTILSLGLHHVFKKCEVISFSDASELTCERAAFSLHPPQTARWKYASPTRIFRALQYDYNLPVLTKKFAQHPIEDLALEYSGDESLIQMYRFFNDQKQLFQFINPAMKKYTEISKRGNDAIIAHLELFGKGQSVKNSDNE